MEALELLKFFLGNGIVLITVLGMGYRFGVRQNTTDNKIDSIQQTLPLEIVTRNAELERKISGKIETEIGLINAKIEKELGSLKEEVNNIKMSFIQDAAKKSEISELKSDVGQAIRQGNESLLSLRDRVTILETQVNVNKRG